MYHSVNVLSSGFHLCCKPTIHLNILLFTCSTQALSLYLARVNIAESHKATLTFWKPASSLLKLFLKESTSYDTPT